jgi:hypothetical protein
MTFGIRRAARGLQNVLNIYGGQTPGALLEEVRPTLDLLQLYGLNQIQVRQANNVALAEGGQVALVVPDSETWVLFGLVAVVVKTGTQTALRVNVGIWDPQLFNHPLKSESMEPFGATETGTSYMAHHCPYPMIVLPKWSLRMQLDVLGTDANANCAISALVGVLA